jgi:hypothetical protein
MPLPLYLGNSFPKNWREKVSVGNSVLAEGRFSLRVRDYLHSIDPSLG